MLWPKRGFEICSNDLILDIYGKNDGYFFVTTRSNGRYKLMVEKDNHRLPYDIKGNGRFDLIPLNMGDGIYKVTLYRNVTGNKYQAIATQWVSVRLNRPDASFYIPNQYVDYSETSAVVDVAKSLWKESEKEYYDAVVKYVRENYHYDYIKAVTRKNGMLPDIGKTIATGLGICQDLAALVVALLRLHGIKSKLVIGHADRQYHAWTVNTIDGKNILFDPTHEINAIGKVKNYINERTY